MHCCDNHVSGMNLLLSTSMMALGVGDKCLHVCSNIFHFTQSIQNAYSTCRYALWGS